MHALKKWWVLLGMVTTLSAQESVSMTPAEATKETLDVASKAHVIRKGDVDALSVWLGNSKLHP